MNLIFKNGKIKVTKKQATVLRGWLFVKRRKNKKTILIYAFNKLRCKRR